VPYLTTSLLTTIDHNIATSRASKIVYMNREEHWMQREPVLKHWHDSHRYLEQKSTIWCGNNFSLR